MSDRSFYAVYTRFGAHLVGIRIPLFQSWGIKYRALIQDNSPTPSQTSQIASSSMVVFRVINS